MAELLRLKRKYGGSIAASLEHLARSEDRLREIETSDERERELNVAVAAAHERYLELARKLHKERVRAAKKFEQAVEKGIAEVAIDNARFQVQVNDSVDSAGQKGIDHTEFYFSANVG